MTTVPPQTRKPTAAPAPVQTPAQEWVSPTMGRVPRQVSLPVRGIMIAVFAVICAVFLLVLGVKAGENSQTAHQPDANTLSVLQYAQSHSDAPCYAVWGAHDSSWSVKCGDLH